MRRRLATRLAMAAMIVGAVLCGSLVLARAVGLAGGSTVSREAVAGVTEELDRRRASAGPDEAIPVLIRLRAEADLDTPAGDSNSYIAERKAVIGELEQTAAETQGPVLETLRALEAEGLAISWKRFYIVNAISATVKPAAIDRLSALFAVEQISLDGPVRTIDPIKSKGRSRRSAPDATDGIEWGVRQIGAPRVWDELKITGRGVTVGIIDSGTDYNHSALKERFAGYDAASGSVSPQGAYLDTVESGLTTPRNESGFDHGTHVAGTILGAEGDMNRIGVAPGARFVAARALGDQGGSTSSLLEAAEWMLKPGGRAEMAPRVINNSWGGDADADPWFRDIVKAWRAANIMPVFAAGNTSGGAVAGPGSIANPANLPEAFAVGATDSAGRLGSFSRRGPSAFDEQGTLVKPDLSAPGVRVRSAKADTSDGRTYETMSGTSMAAPHVTGTVALMLEANPSLKVREIEEILRSTAVPATDGRYPASPNMGYGHGVVNAYDAVRSALAKGRNDGSDARVTVSGSVLTAGADTQAPQVDAEFPAASYQGQEVRLRARVRDDVSVTGVAFAYRFDTDADGLDSDGVERVSATLVSGTVTDGVWEAGIPAAALVGHDRLAVRAEALDWGQMSKPEAERAPARGVAGQVALKPGIVPGAYETDFEQGADGWRMVGEFKGAPHPGDWSWGEPRHAAEPRAVSGSKLMGTRVGFGSVTKYIDSYLYAPPIDLSNPAHANAGFEYDEFVGADGVCEMKVQVARSEDGPWEDLDQKLVPPGTVPAWRHTVYSLAKWAGASDPVHLRFKFHMPDHGQGVGWYIDNARLIDTSKVAPAEVKGLKATYVGRGAGAVFSFDASAENNIVAYELLRWDGVTETGQAPSGEPTVVATLKADAASLSIRDGAAGAHDGTWAVRAVDSFGNKGAVSAAVSLAARPASDQARFWDFEGADDGGWKTGVLAEGSPNDWERGVPRPVGNAGSTFTLRRAQLGLREKIEANDSVWGTNLGVEHDGLDKGLFRATVSRGQYAYLASPEFTVGPDSEHLSFESLSGLYYLSDYQQNIAQVEVSDDGGKTYYVLAPASDIQRTDGYMVFRRHDADLTAYRGRNVSLRFVIKTTGTQVLNDYDIGWYLDNVSVSGAPTELETFPIERRASVSAASASGGQPTAEMRTAALPDAPTPEASPEAPVDPSSAAAPVPAPTTAVPVPGAEVEIEGLGRRAAVDPATGAYSFTVSTGLWRLTARAYGYAPETFEAPATTDLAHTFILRKLESSSVSGTVRDAGGDPVPGALVRVVSDSNVAIVAADAQGAFTIPALFEGTHTLRAFKQGFEPAEATVTVESGRPATQDLTLGSRGRAREELSFDTGEGLQDLLFPDAGKGGAVRFYPAKKGGRLSSARFFARAQEGVENRTLRVLVLQDDENKRMVTRADVAVDAVPGGWAEVDLEGFDIVTDRAFYVAVVQTKPAGEGYGVARDGSDLSAPGASRSFLYNGGLSRASSYQIAGAFMIRATMAYPEDAADNEPEDATGAGPSEPDTAPEQFTWEVKEDHVELVKYVGERNARVRVPSAHEGKPVTVIRSGAFSWKALYGLTLPETIERIDAGAFEAAFAPDERVSLSVPARVENIASRVFASSGLARVELPGVRRIEARAFDRSKDIEVSAPLLEFLDDDAFGTAPVDGFKYARLFVDAANARSFASKKGLVLVNPAVVKVTVLNAKTDAVEDERTLYGPGNATGYPNFLELDKFYRMGETVEIEAPRNVGLSYDEKAKQVELASPQVGVAFTARSLMGTVKPIIEGAPSAVVGESLPNTTVRVTTPDGEVVEGAADARGFYRVELTRADLGDRFRVEHSDAAGKTYEHIVRVTEAVPGRVFIMEGGVKGRLVDYLGHDTSLRIPATVEDAGGTPRAIKEIAPLALAEKGIEELPGFESIQGLSKIGNGAFLGNKLANLRFPNDVREVGAWSFADNRLKDVRFSNLLHMIGRGAFANNEIESVRWGAYTQHFGPESFANNRLTSVVIPARTEELGERAFAHNRLSNLVFESARPDILATPSSSGGHGHVLTGIASGVFSHNELRDVALPAAVTSVADDAFANNGALVNLVTPHADSIHDSVLGPDSGHIVNGGSVRASFVDVSDGSNIRPTELWVGQGMTERVTADASQLLRIGKEAVLTAPEIKGYRVVIGEQRVVPTADGATAALFTYERVAAPAPGPDDPNPHPSPNPDPSPSPNPDPKPDPNPGDDGVGSGSSNSDAGASGAESGRGDVSNAQGAAGAGRDGRPTRPLHRNPLPATADLSALLAATAAVSGLAAVAVGMRRRR
ncbi:MAG: hypothetical protein E7001_01715 [Coriobacteriaceae bacterium]|nr:hypothetical protein [Coriobacteriaceae bacterium]